MKKQVIKTVILVTFAAMLITGCGKKKEETAKNNSDKTASAGIVDDEEYGDCIDMPAIAATVKINDEQMQFPIDITKLKDTISLGALEQTTNKNFYRGTLLDSDAVLGVVNLYSESGSVEEDGYIHFLEVTEGSPWYLSVGGVTFGASVEEVKNAIGTPSFETGDELGSYRVYYENGTYEYLAFTFEGGILKTISIEYLPKEWRQ